MMCRACCGATSASRFQLRGGFWMTPTYVMAVRAYAAAKELLALIGLAALFGYFLLPLPASDFGVKHLPTLGAELFPVSSAAAAGATAPSAAQAAREREQR